MRRFTESLLFGVLFLLLALSWWLMAVTGNMPRVNPRELAPMTVAVVVILATPAFLVVTILAFFRALTRFDPRSFWAWAVAGFGLSAAFAALARFITEAQQIQIGFSNIVWFTAILALASLIGLVLGITHAIPSQEEIEAQKRDRQAEKKRKRKEEKQHRKEEKIREAEVSGAGAEEIPGEENLEEEALAEGVSAVDVTEQVDVLTPSGLEDHAAAFEAGAEGDAFDLAAADQDVADFESMHVLGEEEKPKGDA